MVKRHSTITIEDDLIVEAKENFINISAVTEIAIREALGKKKVEIDKPDECWWCNRREDKATYNNLMGMTWLYPDEKWICSGCLKNAKP